MKAKCVTPTCQTEVRLFPASNPRSLNQTGHCRACKDAMQDHPTVAAVVPPPAAPPTVEEQVALDRQKRAVKAEESVLKVKYNHALKRIETLESQVGALDYLRENVAPIEVHEHFGSGTSEATPMLVASDWHVEEIVDKEISGKLNRYNPDIAKERAETFFQAGLRLINLLNQDVKIPQVVLPLLGDFISNELHGADSAEKNAMQPTDALVFAQNLLIGGIQFLLNHSDFKLIVPCHSGNHGRFTLKTRMSAENGHSLEYLMYLHLRTEFKSEPRVQFQIADGYHSYLPIYSRMVRMHHGHGLKYLGGVGGLTIPANKAIGEWNKGIKADLDVFGHYHTLFDGRDFLSNGSMIGYNGYALSIKAPYQPPMQWLTLFDKKRGRTCSWPILFNR